MPNPEQMRRNTPELDYDVARLLRLAAVDANPLDLAEQVALLREEIAALRTDLMPMPSLIHTGREVLAEFKRLSRAAADR